MSEENKGSDLDRLERALETIDISKRESMRKMVVGTMFIAPVVMSFAIDGLTTGSAMAAASNQS